MKTKEELLNIYSSYLPYELKFIGDSDDIKTLTPSKLVLIENLYYGSLEKPILYSMDYLTKEIEHKGEKFYPYEKLHLCFSDVTNFLNEDLWIGQWWDYEKVCKLLEWHFNVFGLSDSEYIKKETLNQ